MAEQIAVLAGGCFWCTEAVFLDVIGVKSVESGYTGGTVANPTYKQVCGGDTGHAEATRVTFDPDEISYDELLGIEGDSDRLGVSSVAAANLLVGRIGSSAAGIAALDRVHADNVEEHRFGAPEASACQDCDFFGHVLKLLLIAGAK